MKTINTEPQRRINPLNDFVFCKVFGEKGDEVQLLGFINAVLGRSGNKRIISVEILEDKTFSPEIIGNKGSVFDVRAVLNDGTRVNVEVQLRNRGDMDKRSLFYWGREYTDNLDKGQYYRDLPDVIAINIVNFDFPPAVNYHTRFCLREDTEHDLILTGALEIHFLNMVKWRKLAGRDVLNDPLNRWMTWFNEKSPPELISEVKKMDEAIMTADERMAFISGDKEMIRSYNRRMMALSDYTSTINFAREQGIAEGMEKGKAEGRMEGKAEGRMEGRMEGKAESNLEFARKMKARGRPLAEIAEDTGLSPEAVRGL